MRKPLLKSLLSRAGNVYAANNERVDNSRPLKEGCRRFGIDGGYKMVHLVWTGRSMWKYSKKTWVCMCACVWEELGAGGEAGGRRAKRAEGERERGNWLGMNFTSMGRTCHQKKKKKKMATKMTTVEERWLGAECFFLLFFCTFALPLSFWVVSGRLNLDGWAFWRCVDKQKMIWAGRLRELKR